MTAIQYPLINLEMDDEVARYVGLLERRVLMLTLDNLKCRTVLELLTDQAWDDQSFPDDEAELKRVAEDALVRRLGVSEADAASIVAERWGVYNPPEVPDETARFIVGPDKSKRPVYVPTAQSTSPGYDIEKHRAGLARVQANKDAAAAADAKATAPESTQP